MPHPCAFSILCGFALTTIVLVSRRPVPSMVLAHSLTALRRRISTR